MSFLEAFGGSGPDKTAHGSLDLKKFKFKFKSLEGSFFADFTVLTIVHVKAV
jgi:hypothetical protein